MNQQEQERRARLLRQGAERLPDIKKRFEEAQKRNFNSNFAAGGKDAHLSRAKKTSTPKPAKVSKSPKSPKPKPASKRAQNPPK